jgi:hypothetical protein
MRSLPVSVIDNHPWVKPDDAPTLKSLSEAHHKKGGGE